MAIREQSFDEGASDANKITAEDLLKADPTLAHKLQGIQKRRNNGGRVFLAGLFIAGLGLAGYQAWENPPHPKLYRAKYAAIAYSETFLRSLGYELRPEVINFDNLTPKGTLITDSFITVSPTEFNELSPAPVTKEDPNTFNLMFPLEISGSERINYERKLSYNKYSTPEEIVKQDEANKIANFLYFDTEVGKKVRINLDKAYIKMTSMSRAIIAYPAQDGQLYVLYLGFAEDSFGYTLTPLTKIYTASTNEPFNIEQYRSWTPLTNDQPILDIQETGEEKLKRFPTFSVGLDVIGSNPPKNRPNLKIVTKLDSKGQRKIAVASY